MMKTPAALLACLSLANCAAAPTWLAVASPALTYVASVNNLGTETLKVIKPVSPQDPAPIILTGCVYSLNDKVITCPMPVKEAGK